MSALYPLGGEFTIDGVSSDTWHCFYTSWNANLMPSIRANNPDIPGRYGKVMAAMEWSSRVVTLDISLASRITAFADMQAIAAAIDPTLTGPHKLVLVDDNPHQYINVVPNADAPVAPTPATADFTLSFEALDPFWYRDVAQHLAPGKVASGGTLVLPNVGTAPAAPVFTITRPAGTGTLTGLVLTISGVTLNYAGIINPGDTVVINTDTMTLTKNGASDIANWSGDFPLIPAGGSVLHYSDTGNFGANLVVDYTERYT